MFRRLADDTVILTRHEAKVLWDLLKKEYINYNNPEAIRVVQQLGTLAADEAEGV